MKLLQLILLCLLAASCTKKVNDTFWVQVNTNGGVYAKIKTNQKYDLYLKNRDCRKKGTAIYKLTKIDGFTFKKKHQMAVFLSIHRIATQPNLPYISFIMEFYSTFGDTLRYRDNMFMTKSYDAPDEVEIGKILTIGRDTLLFDIRIYSPETDLKIPESTINYLLEFTEQVEILELKERCTLCKRKKIKGFQNQGSD